MERESAGREEGVGKAVGPSFLRRNWVVIPSAVVALLLLAAAFLYWLWLPHQVGRVARAVAERLAAISGAEISYGEVRLEGISRLHLADLMVKGEGEPLVRAGRLAIDFDLFTLTEGLPTLLQVSLEAVRLRGVRLADGSDNFSRVIEALARHLFREQSDADGPRSLIARLLRQTPPLRIDDLGVSFALQEDEGGELVEALLLTGGQLVAMNPSLSAHERAYQVSLSFAKANGDSRLELECDLDIGERTAQLLATFKPAMRIVVRGQEATVEQVSFSSSEFAELVLGRVALTNPLADAQLLAALMEQAGGATGLAEAMERNLSLDLLFKQLDSRISPRLEQAGYSARLWPHFSEQLRRLANRLLRKLLAEAEGEQLMLERVRVLQTMGNTRSGRATRRVKLSFGQGDQGGGQVNLLTMADTGLIEGNFNIVSPTGLFQLAGEVEKEGDRVALRADVTASCDDPTVRLKSTVAWREGRFEGDVRAQFKSEEPALALTVDLAARGEGLSGRAEGEFLIPGLLFGRRIVASFRPEGWSLDLDGTAYLPAGGGPVALELSVDSQAGLKRLSASGSEDLRLGFKGYDLLLRKARMGRDGVLHLEELAVAPAGGLRERALVVIGDLAVTLAARGEELFARLRDLDPDEEPVRLAASLVDGVEVVSPVFKLWQPLPLVPAAAGGEEREETSDKLPDNLEEGSDEVVPMHESYRKALERAAVGTGQAVRGFVAAALKMAEAFPLDKVRITNGKFEYSGGVDDRDRLLSELSEFSGTIRKQRRPGDFGGRLEMKAEFMTAGSEPGAKSSLTAEVDLGSGDLKGELAVERMPLSAYQFFFPSSFSPTALSLLEGGKVGFKFSHEEGRFAIWGRGRLTQFRVPAGRLSSRSVEGITLGLTVGDGPTTGLLFEPDSRSLRTASPVKIDLEREAASLQASFAIDASVPDYPTFELGVQVQQAEVNALLAAIPAAMRSALEEVRVSGAVALNLDMAADSKDLNKMRFSLSAQEEGTIRLDHPGKTVDFEKLRDRFVHQPPTSKERKLLIGDGPGYVPLNSISPWLVLAVTTCEDGSFFRHEGFNTFQARMSVIRNLEQGRFARGASTITMQLMKNLYLSHEKTLSRKLQEVILTWLVEKELSKERLIELYLNIIEWGDGIYGVKEACDFYFGGLPPANLNPSQAAFLASFIPYPRPFHAKFKAAREAGKRTKSQANWWERRHKLVKRIVRAMVNNCQKLSSKCPTSEPYCRVLEQSCADPGRELTAADNTKSLDDLFRPVIPAPETEEPSALEL